MVFHLVSGPRQLAGLWVRPESGGLPIPETQRESWFLDDPDGIVIDHRLVASGEVRQVMNGAARFVSEPLLAHLEEGVTDGRTFAYRLDASEPAGLSSPLSVH